MNMLIKCRDYTGAISFHWGDCMFHGYAMGLNTRLEFNGKSVEEATQDFSRVINEYVSDCRKRGVRPEKPYIQRKRVYIDKALFQRIRSQAEASDQTANEVAEQALLECFPADSPDSLAIAENQEEV